MRVRRTGLVAYVAVAHALIHTIELSYAVLLSRIENEFGAGLFVLGIVANVFAFAFGFSALPSGVLVDRLGTQRVLLIAFGLAAVSALLVATAPNTVVLAIFLAILGLSIGLYHPAGLALIAQVTAQNGGGGPGRGMALGWHGVAGNLGIAAAPAIAIGPAVALDDWRWAYVLLALLSGLFALSLAVVKLEQPAAVEAVDPEPAEEATSDGAASSSEPLYDRVRAMLPLLLVYGVFVMNGFVYRGSLTFLPVHLEERLRISWFGLDEAWLVGSLTTLALLAGAVGQLFGGALSERFRLERLAVPLTFSMIPFLLLMGTTTGLPLVLFSACFIFANFSGQPIFTGLIADYTPQRLLGRSYGVSFFAAFGIGSLAATVAGFFADRWGTDSVFLVLAAFVTVTVTLSFAIWRLGEGAARRERAQGGPPAPGWSGK